MLKTLLIFSLFLSTTFSLAQLPDSLQTFQKQRIAYQKKGMLTLGSWSLVNIAGGAVGYATSTGESRYFHQMNAGWNSVNLILAVTGYIGAHRELNKDYTREELFYKQQRTEQVFLFNSALNFTYITAGFLLMERAQNRPEQFHQFQGFGKSLILQGSFLFAFDTFNFLLHRKHGKRKLY